MYEQGNGVTKNDKEAVRWFRKSAELGYADAQFKLGLKCDSGKGTEEDHEEAVRWYRLAAAQGLASAQTELDAYSD